MWETFGGWSLFFVGVFCFYAGISETLRNKRRKREEKRLKKELMDWLFFVGIMMDGTWKNSQGYSKDATKEWLAKMTAIYFQETLRRRDEH